MFLHYGTWWILIGLCVRERRPTWAEERRMNSETFGIPLRHNRGRGGFRGRGFMPPRGGRGRLLSQGSFGPPRGAPPGFRGGFRGGRGGRDFSDFEYRVNDSKLLSKCSVQQKMHVLNVFFFLFFRRITRWLRNTAATGPHTVVAAHSETISVEEALWVSTFQTQWSHPLSHQHQGGLLYIRGWECSSLLSTLRNRLFVFCFCPGHQIDRNVCKYFTLE